MKKFVLYTALAALGLFGTTSCSDFGDVNIDPEHFNDENMEYDLMFTNAQHQALGSDWDVWRNGIIYGATMMQHVTSVDWRQVFYTWSSDYNSAYWDAMYTGDRAAVRDLAIVMRQWKDNEDHVVDYQIARIVRAYVFHRLTDLYGDIPYSEAARADEGIFYPKYDKQQDIYMDILKELNEAQAALEGTTEAEMGAADVYYGGNTVKWRKFANSLMLRVAMRLTKVDEATAKQWVQTAVKNGLIDNNDDNAMLLHPEGNVNNDASEPYAKIYVQSDPGKFFISESFMKLLKDSNDPRLPMIATVIPQGKDATAAYTSDGFDKGDNTPDKQKGMPMGYTVSGDAWDLSNAPGYDSIPYITDENGKRVPQYRNYYSTVNRDIYGDPKAPTFIVTYAENQLLLAEAALRGWVSGNAGEYYETAIRAAMAQFSQYTNATAVVNKWMTTDKINTYVENNKLSSNKEEAMKQINTQYYIVTFCDTYETFANWRRSGYPELVPVNNDGYPNAVTNRTIPRRFTYPTTESTINEANYLDASKRLLPDGDKMTSRVWWDAE